MSSASHPTPPAVATVPPERSRFELWLDRTWLVWFVIVCFLMGMELTVLPWTPWWLKNNLLRLHPAAREIAQNYFFRGLVSGLGFLDVWIGLSVAAHYTEREVAE